MKIGIMTCWQPDDNYGSQMQCFALQHYLRTQGHDAFLIRYVRANDIVSEKKTIYKKLIRVLKIFNIRLVLQKIHNMKIEKSIKNIDIESRKHNREAPLFRDRYLYQTNIYNSYNELKENPPEADLYIVGSDQVWNNHPKQIGQFNAFFLNFGNSKTKRISYAASFGFDVQNMHDGYKDNALECLSYFNGISVRETAGLQIVNFLGIHDAIKVADPTLLLEADYYRNIYNENEIRKPKGKYILLYNLVSFSAIDADYIKKWADSRGLELIYVTGHGKVDDVEKFYATIPEWLYLIDNAEYVITNSFHGSIFSTIFHKQFVVFKLQDFFSVTNNRLKTIEELLEQDRSVSSLEEFEAVIDTKIDWNLFEKNKANYTETGKNFLRKYTQEN